MSETDQNDERCWERGWEGHTEAQLRRLARLPLVKKLEWLEQAHRVVRLLRSTTHTDDDGTDQRS